MGLAKAVIDLDALRHNLRLVQHAAPTARIMAMVKANAYGHGMLACLPALQQADALATARVEEAIELREAGYAKRVVVVSGVIGADEINACIEHGVEPVLHSMEAVAAMTAITTPRPVDVWLKIDTGMHRLGITSEEYRAALNKLKRCDAVGDIHLMTHFASADEPANPFTDRQTKLFFDTTARERLPKSLANSAAILTRKQTHADWVRPGIMLYGIDPLPSATELSAQLRPVMTLVSKVVAMRNVPSLSTVGYGQRWTAARDTRIATVAIGYGDGYPRHAASGTPVWIRGQMAPIAGRVSMDLITVDVTDIDSVHVGDEVELWGAHLPANVVAPHASTIAYTLVTGVTDRVELHHVN
jgi:alanine racemase